ncbi:MAG: hypothetical protein AB1765_12285, partial [Candidatus Hydrogenedentota bacterium]
MQTFKALIIDPSSENRVELKKIMFNVEQAEKTIECANIEEGIQKFEEENTEVILLNADSEEILNKGELIEELDIKTHNASIIAYSAQIKSDPTYTVKII